MEEQTENGDIPYRDLPFVNEVSGSSYISLQHQQDRRAIITIRGQHVNHVSSNYNIVAPRANDDNIISLHPTESPNTQGPSGIEHLLMHEVQNYQRRETITEAYRRRLRTFRNWRVHFLDPEVLAEANFCYTGMGDTVRCVVCGGELSNWQRGNDPRIEHINAFGFACRE